MGDGGISCIQPEPGDDRAMMLTTFVATNNEAGVRRVLARDPGAVNELGLDGTSPLCSAAMWGNDGLLRLLLESMASPHIRNDNGPMWTPLHAAALQEHGKACMLLLDYKADPQEKDAEGVTPCYYASCSEGVWPFFAARGCERVDKAELVQKGVLRKASSKLEAELAAQEPAPGGADDAADAGRRGLVTEYSRPGSAYVVTREFPPRPGSAAPPQSSPLRGSPLRGTPPRSGGSRQSLRPIDILEEVDESALGTPSGASAAAGLRSLAF
mmetsp:Transcript_21862/g.61108  ORF Transcript_21862/g.61108 Transcript_21862/m.61108 type:complete len:270 (+) Transcript_21862:81-890(+)